MAPVPVSDYLKHLRLGFQLLLAPLFLWGFALSGGPLDWKVAAGFISLHLFLYPGATAFNAAFDRDEGPVSGLAAPPPPPRHLLAFSLALQAAGTLPAVAVGSTFLFLYALLALVFAAYSHPAARWKARPVASSVAVALGQGGLGFAAGWCAGVGTLPPLSDALAWLGGAAATFTTLGLYPSTQIFQVEEDRARGDRTLAVVLGPARALRLGALFLAAGGTGAAACFLLSGRLSEAGLLLMGYALLVLRHVGFAAGAGDAPEAARYAWATATRRLAACGFLLFLLFVLVAGVGWA